MLGRNASTLVIAEHDSNTVVPLTYNAIAAAKQIGGDVAVLLAGKDCSKVEHNLSVSCVIRQPSSTGCKRVV